MHHPKIPSCRLSVFTAGLALISAALLIGCDGSRAFADSVFVNGYVYTVDDQDSVAQAVAIKDGRILMVGTTDEMQALIGATTRVVDLQGKMMMPGMVDGHVHTLWGAAATKKCSLDFAPLTVSEMKSRLAVCLHDSAYATPDTWLEVVNWDRQAMLSRDRDPTRVDLDDLPTGRPIIITSIDYHTRLLNSRGLTIAGVGTDTPDPPDGKVMKDAAGQPTGILEDGAVRLGDDALPPLTDDDRLSHARTALELLRQQGITSFLEAQSDEASVRAYAELAERGELTARANFAIEVAASEGQAVNERGPLQVSYEALTRAKAVRDKYETTSEKTVPGIRVRHVKLFLDGVLQAPAQTAATLAPYIPLQCLSLECNGGSGHLYFGTAYLQGVVKEAMQQGFQPHFHAIGDAAVRQALDAVEQAAEQRHLASTSGTPAIAHAELVDPSDMGRFKSLGVTPVMSFQWAQQAPYSVEAVKSQLGPTRYERMEPEGSLWNAGAALAYGSDWPVDPLAYFYNLRVGVTRSGDPTHPASFGPAYAGRLNSDPLLTRGAALRAITMNAAAHLGLDKRVGSIEQGKLADLIVLDNNFMTAPETSLAYTNVLMTMVGGKEVWQRPVGERAPALMQNKAPIAPRPNRSVHIH